MLLGYARVSTDEQDHALQIEALNRAGCERVYVETASGTRTDRPELTKLLEQVRSGDTVIVWRLDRAGRSLRHLIDITDDLQRRGVALRSLTEGIDTSTPTGRLLCGILGAVAQMEVEALRERTRSGLRIAGQQGRKGGRRSRSRVTSGAHQAHSTGTFPAGGVQCATRRDARVHRQRRDVLALRRLRPDRDR